MPKVKMELSDLPNSIAATKHEGSVVSRAQIGAYEKVVASKAKS